MNKENKNVVLSKKQIGIFVLLMLVLAVVAISVTVVLINRNKENDNMKVESNVITENGKNSKNFEEEQAEADASKIGVKINKNIVFNDANSSGNILLENTSKNKNSFSVSLCIEDTSEEVYKSGIIEYGTRIDEINLSKKLEKGTYNAVAYLTAYDQSGNKKGTSGLNVTINVLN